MVLTVMSLSNYQGVNCASQFLWTRVTREEETSAEKLSPLHWRVDVCGDDLLTAN